MASGSNCDLNTTNPDAVYHHSASSHDGSSATAYHQQRPHAAVMGAYSLPNDAQLRSMTTPATPPAAMRPAEQLLSAAPLAHSTDTETDTEPVRVSPLSPTERSASDTTPPPRHSSPISRNTPSPNVREDGPLSTEDLPIPEPPQTTEAEDAYQQVFDTIEAAAPHDTWSDSGYSASQANSTSTSLSSSVRDYEFENGRRYHAYAAGRYLLPNDDAEQEREDMKHSTVLNVCGGKLHFAPLDENSTHQIKVLDLGTGTGIWCVEMGDQYPSADIIGVDLSPHQPDWVPPNVRFEVDDIENEWLWGEAVFDMVHARHMSLGIKDWDHVLSSAYQALKPGGWIEFCEFDYWPNSDDGTMTPENMHLFWTHKVTEGLGVVGIDLHAGVHLKNRIERAGYKNVVEHIIKVPIGQWPKNQLLKKVGMYMHAVLYDGLQGIAMGPLTRALGWSKEQVEVMLPAVRKDLNDLSIHTYYSLHVVFGQKV